jgi:hypothetical protein
VSGDIGVYGKSPLGKIETFTRSIRKDADDGTTWYPHGTGRGPREWYWSLANEFPWYSFEIRERTIAFRWMYNSSTLNTRMSEQRTRKLWFIRQRQQVFQTSSWNNWQVSNNKIRKKSDTQRKYIKNIKNSHTHTHKKLRQKPLHFKVKTVNNFRRQKHTRRHIIIYQIKYEDFFF